MRDLFIQELLTWVGTPYMKDACVKKGGTNCSMFALDAAEQVFGKLPIAGEHLRETGHFRVLRNDPIAVIKFLEFHCKRIREWSNPGDIVVVSFLNIPCQVLVYTGSDKFIYSTKSLGVVHDHAPGNLLRKAAGVYRPRIFEGE